MDRINGKRGRVVDSVADDYCQFISVIIVGVTHRKYQVDGGVDSGVQRQGRRLVLVRHVVVVCKLVIVNSKTIDPTGTFHREQFQYSQAYVRNQTPI